MHGAKTFQPKMFVNFCLANYIPKDNFINANASIDRMVDVKLVNRSLEEYLDEIRSQDGKPLSMVKANKIRPKKLATSKKNLERFTEMRKEL